MIINGIYLDGKTSKRIVGRLEVLSDLEQVVLHFDENKQNISLLLQIDTMVISTRLGQTPREIAFCDNQLFITDDNDAIDKLAESTQVYRKMKYSFMYKLENNYPLVILFTLSTILFVWASIVYGIPSAAKLIADEIPSFTHAKLGTSLDVLDKTLLDPSELTTERQQALMALFSPYLQSHQKLNPQLKFRSGMKANALALPGGEIVFTDELVNLAKNDDELLAILFHELGHLHYKHMTRRVLQDAMFTLMVIFITGDVETIDLVTALPTLILDLSYSRDFEKEADNYALEQLYKNNIDLNSFANIMQLLENYYVAKRIDDIKVDESKESSSDFFSTHPATESRIQLVAEFKRQRALL